MPTLTLKFKKDAAIIRNYEIEKGQSLTIGRLEDNDIMIENLAVSGHHAKIDNVGDDYLLTDLKSKNGTFVNEQTAVSHWLKPGDIITIGKHILIFSYADDEIQPSDDSGAMNQTMVMDTGKYRDMVAKNVSEAAKGESIGILSYLAGGEGEVELTKKLTKIGKADTSDIVVKGLSIGQTAFTISKRPNGYHLSYVSGLSKPKVNGKGIKETVGLKQFDVIEIGSVKMQLVNK